MFDAKQILIFLASVFYFKLICGQLSSSSLNRTNYMNIYFDKQSLTYKIYDANTNQTNLETENLIKLYKWNNNKQTTTTMLRSTSSVLSTTKPTTSTTSTRTVTSTATTSTTSTTKTIVKTSNILQLTTPSSDELDDENPLVVLKSSIRKVYTLPPQTNCVTDPLRTKNRYGRIVDGIEADPHSYPFLASVRKFNRARNFVGEHFCGGALIYERYILTAAHCVHELNESDIAIVMGLHDSRDIQTKYAQLNTYQVSKIIIHDKFNFNNLENDIALIKLSRNVTLSKYVSLVCLPESSKLADSIYQKLVIVAGWGKTSNQKSVTKNTPQSYYLQQTFLNVINQDPLCTKYSKRFDLKKYYCVYDSNFSGASNVCFGDSGGPLFLNINGRYYSYGILSFVFSYVDLSTGKSYCLVNAPSYFTKVPLYLDWMARKINRNKLY